MELIKVTNGQIEIANEFMKKWHDFQLQKEAMDLQEKQIKQALLEAMETNGITKFENDYLKVNYTGPSQRKTVDTDALKMDGLYEAYIKTVAVKPSVKISWK